MIFTKEAHQSAKFQTFDCSSEIHQIYTLISSFCWKHIKFWLKKYRGVMSHDTEDWRRIWRKTGLLFQKWQEFGEFWSKHSKVSKICTLIGPFREKYITSYLRKYRGVIFHNTEESCKIWKKLAGDLENDMRNFHQNIQKSQELL